MSFQSYFFHHLTYKSMSEFIQNPRSKKDASAKPWNYPISQTHISCKILTQQHVQVHPAQSLTGNWRCCVWGQQNPAAFCSLLVVFQHPHWISKGISKSPPFLIHYGTFIQQFISTCLYSLHPLSVAASSRLVKELSALLNWHHTS